MNILKATAKGIVIVTKCGVCPELLDKLENCGSYHMKMIKKQCDKIASWEIVDNDMCPGDKNFPKIIKVTSVPFNNVDADCVSTFAKMQKNVLIEVVNIEAASLKIERVSNMTNEVFKAMLDTTLNLPENEEN